MLERRRLLGEQHGRKPIDAADALATCRPRLTAGGRVMSKCDRAFKWWLIVATVALAIFIVAAIVDIAGVVQ